MRARVRVMLVAFGLAMAAVTAHAQFGYRYTSPEVRDAIRTAKLDRLLIPILDAYRPQFVLMSAGYDAHAGDPLAQLLLTVDDYTWITARIVELAKKHARGRIVSSLEGGYALDALAASACAHVQTLAGL